MISRAGVPVYIDYAHTARRARSGDRRASAARRGPADHRVRRRRRPRPGQAAGDGRGRGAAVRRGDRHRRQSAQRGSGARSAPTIMAGAPGATEVAGRREAIAEAIRIARAGDIVLVAGKGHETGQIIGDQRASVRRCAGRAGVRGMSALWTSRRDRRGDRRHGERAVRSHRRHLRQPRGAARATCSSPCRARSTTATSSSTAPSPPAPRARSSRSRSTARTCWSRTRSRRSRRSAARRASGRKRDDHRGHRLGRQDQHQGSALRRARPHPAGQGPPLGQELQQPYRRAAEPRPDAARRRIRGARNGHEQCRRDRRADPAWSGRTSRSITAIAPAHIENLGSEEAIADAKARDFRRARARRHRHHPQRHAAPRPAGQGRAAPCRPDHHLRRRRCRRPRASTPSRAEGGGSLITAALLERELTFTISQRGEHWVSNALAVLAAVEAVGADVARRRPRAGRHGRAQGPRRAPHDRSSTAARCC